MTTEVCYRCEICGGLIDPWGHEDKSTTASNKTEFLRRIRFHELEFAPVLPAFALPQYEIVDGRQRFHHSCLKRLGVIAELTERISSIDASILGDEERKSLIGHLRKTQFYGANGFMSSDEITEELLELVRSGISGVGGSYWVEQAIGNVG